MTLAELNARCDYWLERLDMGEWRGKVKVTILPESDMPRTLGQVCWSAEECSAEIEIREGEGENTLLHEIGHLLLEGHNKVKRYNPMHERAINRLTAALLK